MEEAWEFAALDMGDRPAIPVAMQRAIKEEAGYRCAVPTCRDKGPFDFEHIEEWSKVKKHEEHNIILLCVGCHARVTRGEIHKEAVRAYKRNLALISARYSLYEMRVMEIFWVQLKNDKNIFQSIQTYEQIHIMGLMKDKIIQFFNPNPDVKTTNIQHGVDVSMKHYILTKYGQTFVSNFFQGNEI